MRQPTHNTAKLPRRLLEEIGVQGKSTSFQSRDRSSPKRDGGDAKLRRTRVWPVARKERRKALRVEKTARHVRTVSQKSSNHKKYHTLPQDTDDLEVSESSSPQANPQFNSAGEPNFILKPQKSVVEQAQEVGARSEDITPHVSSKIRGKLAADDAEIEALERALGVKGKKGLPKVFEDDGLDDLLGGLHEQREDDKPNSSKRRRNEEDDWLENKRRKASQKGYAAAMSATPASLSGQEDNDTESTPEEAQSTGDDGSSESDDFEGFDDGSAVFSQKPIRMRENPYVAPNASESSSSNAKYVPPSLRAPQTSEQEGLRRLRRQIQGLLNRLSEANILGVLNDFEKLYLIDARHDVSSSVVDLLIGLLSDSSVLQDTFVILHAGFIAGAYKLIGTDFGAQCLQSIVEEFNKIFETKLDGDSNGKKLTNLISLLAELYNFQVIGSGLIYDFIRLFLEDLTQLNVELLLKIFRNSGPQLRQDDPSALKDIVLLLQSAVSRTGARNISVRTKFMIEIMNNLKNNRMRTGIAASTITSEHTILMKKTLGSLNTRNLKASEPLRVGLNDIKDTDKRGKWWLVGATYNPEEQSRQNKFLRTNGQNESFDEREELNVVNDSNDLLQLARQHRMNTDVRRSIFITIMSATDYRDAHLRLSKLGLKASQRLEIPKVLMHCAGAEGIYNPFYTLIARLLCSDHKLKMAFQFSLWDAFKKMDEGDENDGDDEEDQDSLETRIIVNLAKMYGALVADGGLGIGILKNLNLVYLQPNTRIFVELFLITVIVDSQHKYEDHRHEKSLLDIFLKLKDFPEMVSGIRYFLKKVVSRTDVASSPQDKMTIKWGCKVVDNTLLELASMQLAEK